MRQPSTDSDVPNSTKTAIVTFYWGPDEYSFVTAGRSVCHVASIALERFSSDWWQGCQGRSKSRPVGEGVAVFVGRLERSLRSPFRAAQA